MDVMDIRLIYKWCGIYHGLSFGFDLYLLGMFRIEERLVVGS